ncbi:MAG: B12-binding domain-containing radical SAM protein [Bdellovibrionales bacterium RIFOXYD1_FULL_53_11]|nr:MAG: B12-binding domain-containing radical SAM protein [Bdellovibrionales bacterium RIFOXYD1_FULL_53_11]
MKILLVVYDNDSYIHWFPIGLGYIASVLEKAGHEVAIYSQDYHHYKDEHLTWYLDNNRFDVVGVNIIGGYYQYKKIIKISEAINKSKQRPLYVLGGHGPSPEPAFYFKKTGADVIVIGEGEITAVNLLKAIENRTSLKNVDGIAFMENAKCVVNKRTPLVENIDELPFPAFHLFPVEYYRLLRMPHVENHEFVFPALSGRGCPYKCNFCYRMDDGIRIRDSKSIVEEIKFLKKQYDIGYIAFADELLMSSKKRTVDLCEEFIRADLKIKWDCNGRLNHAVPEVLQLMKKAGCVFVNYGIESFDDRILKNMNKVLNTEQIVKGIEATLSAGISPGYNIIFGNIGENRETLQRGVEFLLKYDDHSQLRTIRPVTPYPGSGLYYHAIEKGLLNDAEDFYENKHLNSDLMSINFTDLTDDEFHASLLEANKALLANYFKHKAAQEIKKAEDLYLKKNTGFRGFRQS